jgi:hypothetical protein
MWCCQTANKGLTVASSAPNARFSTEVKPIFTPRRFWSAAIVSSVSALALNSNHAAAGNVIFTRFLRGFLAGASVRGFLARVVRRSSP